MTHVLNLKSGTHYMDGYLKGIVVFFYGSFKKEKLIFYYLIGG